MKLFFYNSIVPFRRKTQIVFVTITSIASLGWSLPSANAAILQMLQSASKIENARLAPLPIAAKSAAEIRRMKSKLKKITREMERESKKLRAATAKAKKINAKLRKN